MDQPVEGVLEARLVLIGVGADEVDDLAVVIGSLLLVATGLVDHSQSIVAVVHFRVVAHDKVPRGAFGDERILDASFLAVRKARDPDARARICRAARVLPLLRVTRPD